MFEKAPSEAFNPHYLPLPHPKDFNMGSTQVSSREDDIAQSISFLSGSLILGRIWELVEGRLLFDGMWAPRDPFTTEAHLAQMTAVLGAFTERLLARLRLRDQYFDSEGNLIKPSTFPSFSIEKLSKNPNLSAADKTSFLEFIAEMTRIDPEERPDARTLLKANWL